MELAFHSTPAGSGRRPLFYSLCLFPSSTLLLCLSPDSCHPVRLVASGCSKLERLQPEAAEQ